MNTIDADSFGTLMQGGSVWSINNAFVEEVSTLNGRTGRLTISFEDRRQNNTELLILNINWNTVVTDQFGRPVSLFDIWEGVLIDATISSAWTRSIPPQTNAFRIVLQQNQQLPESLTTRGRVARVDEDNGFFITGHPFDINQQTVFVVTDETVILSRNANPIQLYTLCPGQLVEVTHANFQTLSIPPQTTAFHIQTF